MNIEQEFEDLKFWADKNNILFVEGDFERNKSAFIEFPYKGQSSVEIFKQVAEKLNIKVIIYELIHLDVDTYEVIEETVEYLEDDDIKEKFEQLRTLEDKYFGYTLHFFNNGMTFKIENYIDETNDFLEVKEAVDEFIEESSGSDSKFKPLAQEKVIEFGNHLALHENYEKLKNRVQRENLAKQLFSKQFEELNVHIFYGISLIVAQAETYYETQIKPKKEKELKQKISELLNKGWTKVKIAATLGVSKDTVNKYI